MADPQDKLSGEDLAALTETYRHLKDAGDPRADKVGAYIRTTVQSGNFEPMNPANPDHAGFFSSLGSDLWSMAKGAVKPKNVLLNAATMGMGSTVQALASAPQTIEHAKEQKAGGYSLPYRIASPVAENLGVNVRGMEQSAQEGDVAGVGGHAAAIPTVMAATAGLTKAAPAIANASERAALLGRTPEEAYQSALKPSTTIPPAKVDAMVQTGLQNKIPVTAGGAEKLQFLVDDLNNKIKNVIDSDPNRPINKFSVASRLGNTANRFSNQVNPSADLNAISESGNEFLENQPGQIPAKQAQALKQGTYQQLSSKAYGELKSASIEAQKALARGLKEEIANQFPEISGLNAAESRLYDLQPVLDKAVQRIGNHQLIGIGTPIATGATKAVTGSTPMAAAAGVLKAVLDNPGVKSRLAIAISQGGKIPPATAMQRVAAYSAALGAGAASNEAPDNQTTQ